MGIINIIVIGLGLAMDALAVSITSGLTVRRVRIRYALKLALSFAGFQALMPVIGWLAGIRFSEKIRTVDHWVAMLRASRPLLRRRGRHAHIGRFSDCHKH